MPLTETQAIYYKNITLITEETNFGLRKIRGSKNPYVYKLKNSNKSVRIDLLRAFEEVWGDSITLERNSLYKLVSGDFETDNEWRRLMLAYYRVYSKFRSFINETYYTLPESMTLASYYKDRVISVYNKHRQEVIDTLRLNYDGKKLKFLTEDMGYLYYKVPNDFNTSIVKGVEQIVQAGDI